MHAADVARVVEILLTAEGISGEAYQCCDGYVSQWEVANLAKQASGSASELTGGPTSPKHQIETAKIRALGLRFGGKPLLERTIGELVAAGEELKKTGITGILATPVSEKKNNWRS